MSLVYGVTRNSHGNRLDVVPADLGFARSAGGLEVGPDVPGRRRVSCCTAVTSIRIMPGRTAAQAGRQAFANDVRRPEGAEPLAVDVRQNLGVHPPIRCGSPAGSVA
jgi:hypothetical protein